MRSVCAIVSLWEPDVRKDQCSRREIIQECKDLQEERRVG